MWSAAKILNGTLICQFKVIYVSIFKTKWHGFCSCYWLPFLQTNGCMVRHQANQHASSLPLLLVIPAGVLLFACGSDRTNQHLADMGAQTTLALCLPAFQHNISRVTTSIFLNIWIPSNNCTLQVFKISTFVITVMVIFFFFCWVNLQKFK